jgi:O-antigen biosynthesis protein WbqV
MTVIGVSKFGLHTGLFFLGYVLAYEARLALPIEWWLTDPGAVRVVVWAAIYASIGAGTELVFQSKWSTWRFSSIRNVLGLVRNVTITTSLFLILIFLIDRGTQLPRSVLPLAWLISLALLVSVRIVWRLPDDHGLAGHFLPSWWPGIASDRTPTLIVGPMRRPIASLDAARASLLEGPAAAQLGVRFTNCR